MRALGPILLVLLLASPAQAARPLELGVQDDAVLLHRDYGDHGLALDRAAEMGATRVRANLGWARSMPDDQAAAAAPPATIDWDFSALEQLHAEATARGLELQVTLTGPAPAWATGDGAVGNVRPSAADFGAFVRAAVKQFAGRIDRWSVWNEPNWHRLLSPARSAPAIYRGLYRSAHAAIKAQDPSAQVLIGEMMPGANRSRSTPLLKFLRGLTCSRADWRAARSCSALRADGFAIHPYNFARRPRDAKPKNADVVEIGSLARLTRALDRLRSRRALRTPSNRPMPVYVTEFGYFTSGPLARSASTHASWMREAWRIAERNRRVRQLLQYLLVDPWDDEITWRSAVLDRDGTRRPVFFALQAAAEDSRSGR